MKSLSLVTAATLTDQSERTLRRRIADGTLTRLPDEGGSSRTMIPLEEIKAQFCFAVDEDGIGLIERADAGNPEAQNDLGLMLLANKKPERAVYWLELAAKQDFPDAMHWLGHCYVNGSGVPADENLGIMWLSKAAAHGHIISQEQMQAMRDRFTGKQ